MLNLDLGQILVQIIGFLAMLWILKRFGWKPLLDLLEKRQNIIKSEFDSIDAKKEEVDQLVDKYDQKLKELEIDSRRKIQEAIEEGHKISREIQKGAHEEAKEILDKVKLEVQEQVAKAKNQLKDEMVNLVMDVTNKIIKENLNVANQKALIAKFIDEAQIK